MNVNDSFKECLKYKTLIIEHILKTGSITLEEVRAMYPELPRRAPVRYLDRLHNSGHIIECQPYGSLPRIYKIDPDRVDVCKAIVNYYHQVGVC